MRKKTVTRQHKPIYLALPKRPRQYAMEIINITNRISRVDALINVPNELRELTKAHVMSYFTKRQYNRDYYFWLKTKSKTIHTDKGVI